MLRFIRQIKYQSNTKILSIGRKYSFWRQWPANYGYASHMS